MNKSYFYTETAFHHEGDMAYLKGVNRRNKKDRLKWNKVSSYDKDF